MRNIRTRACCSKRMIFVWHYYRWPFAHCQKDRTENSVCRTHAKTSTTKQSNKQNVVQFELSYHTYKQTIITNSSKPQITLPLKMAQGKTKNKVKMPANIKTKSVHRLNMERKKKNNRPKKAKKDLLQSAVEKEIRKNIEARSREQVKES